MTKPTNRGRALRRFLLVLASFVLSFPLASAAAPDCSRALFAGADPGGIGGTGMGGDQDGIGGTGYGDEDGIGGTGFGGDEDGIGGTGVFGTVTAMGSVCVNGIEIEYGQDVPFTVGGAPARIDNLGVGHVVWIEVSRKDGRLTADSITLLMEWVGQVDAVDPARRSVRVSGETIDVLPGAVIRGLPGGPIAFRRGSTVAVSGLRRVGGRIAASRIDRAHSNAESLPANVAELVGAASGLRWLSLEGYLEPDIETRGWELSGIPLDASGLGGAPGIGGERVWLRGSIAGDGLRVHHVLPRPEIGGGIDGAPPLESDSIEDSETEESSPDDGYDADRLLESEIPEVREIPDLIDVRDIPLETDRLDVLDGGSR